MALDQIEKVESINLGSNGHKPEENVEIKPSSSEEQDETKAEMLNLAKRIEDGDYDEVENGEEVYKSRMGKVKVSDIEGANTMIDWLRGGQTGTSKDGSSTQAPPTTIEESKNAQTDTKTKITNGPNIVPQQAPHGPDNPKYKNMGSNRPSLPREEGDTNKGMSDNDYRNTENRNNSYYGPTSNADYSRPGGLTEALKKQDEVARAAGRVTPTDPKETQKEVPQDTVQNNPDDLIKKLREMYDQGEKEKGVKYDTKKSLQEALDPNKRTMTPLEEVQQKLREEQEAIQKAQAEQERKEIEEKVRAASRPELPSGSNIPQLPANTLTTPDAIELPASMTGSTDNSPLNGEDIIDPEPSPEPYHETQDPVIIDGVFRDADETPHEEENDTNLPPVDEVETPEDLGTDPRAQELDALRQEIASLQDQIRELSERITQLAGGGAVPPIEPPDTTPVAEPEPDPIPNPAHTVVDERLNELRNTPEQRVNDLDREVNDLLNGRRPSELSDQERLRYYDLDSRRRALRTELNLQAVETERQRKRKERWIKVGALVVGIGAGVVAAPAVSIAAVVAVTLGGRVGGALARAGEKKLRQRAEQLKYTNRSTMNVRELENLDKRQRRNEWWANRLGEVASVVTWGSAGFGIGVAAHALFTSMTSQANVPTGEVSDSITGQGDSITGQPRGDGILRPEASGDGILVRNGRVDLPGSAWDGNLGGAPAQDTLPGGALNHSNFTGGIHEMAPYQADLDLASAGLTRQQVLDNLGTTGAHQLENAYLNAIRSGNTDPNLIDILTKMGSEGAKNLLSLIQK